MHRKVRNSLVIGLSTLAIVGCFDVVDKVEPAGPIASLASAGPPPATNNNPPNISGIPSANATVGRSWSFTPSSSDPDGDVVTFSIENGPAWANFNPSSGQLSGIPLLGDQGDYSDIRISVSDDQYTAVLPKFSVSVQSISANNGPLISGNPAIDVVVGQTYRFQPTASDPEGDNLTFGIANRPTWATFNSGTGELNGTPFVADAGLHENIVISVSDGQQSASLSSFAINVRNTALENRPPQISGTPSTVATIDQLYSFQPTASDPDGDTLVFTIANPPPWTSFDTDSGQLNGTPVSGQELVYENIQIFAGDGQTTTALPAFSITVVSSNGNNAPSISGIAPSTATIDQLYSFQPTASDADGDVLIFTIANPPPWTTFDVNSGLLSGTPVTGQEAVYRNIQIFVGDGQATTGLPAFSITVDDPNANDAPTISGIAPPEATVDQLYSFRPNAADADGDPLTFTISNQPSWTLFDIATGEIAGTPSSSDVATYPNIVITVSDGDLSSSLAPFSIAVEDPISNEAPTISGIAPPEATVDQLYSFRPSAADADGDPLIFTISNQPSWASFDPDTGEIAGTPLSGDVATYDDIVISVSDGDLSASLAPFSITVSQTATGSVTLSWTPPTRNTDGTPLTDLAGYKIYYGTGPGTYPNEVPVDNPGLTTFVVENLAPNTYYFVSTSINDADVESDFSNEAVKTVN